MRTAILAIAILAAQAVYAQDVVPTILIAQTHAEWMAANTRLTHQPLGKILKRWRTAGENIACGQQAEAEVMRSWLNSSGHRTNILNRNFTHVGFGIAVSENGTVYWCVDFGG